ncbi:MAG: hypothetical protein ETSY1_44920 [Candidatus Entotheonella factor]|uniref:Uncharacterized protein n=1 Tax=Entotheonella factor TaxID=1429438 RepID=W4L2K9_ENTF1|nr:MAG: hypothetical protein ETSY1_44920 [Candidatus Entotheonella factor]
MCKHRPLHAGFAWVVRRFVDHAAKAVLIVLVLSAVAFARRGEAPVSARLTITPMHEVVAVQLPAIDAGMLQRQEQQREKPGVARYAVPAEVHLTPQTTGTWDQLPEGGRLWRLRIEAPGATDLNFGFTRYRLPQGAMLHIISSGSDNVYEGPYTAQDNKDHGQLWTPPVKGGQAVLELYLPSGAEEPELVLTRVGRGFRAP